MQAVTSTRAFTPAVATQRHARRQVTVQALSRPQTAAASVPMIAVILAGTAAMTLAPAALAEDVRTTSAPEGVRKVVCASNPTSKLCLEGSYKRGQAPSLKN
ncbi:LCI3 [Auxenochlorella protothecoides x Auxenochlorella symbiontica]|uniref:Uncharacterized protein n=1 Tax=Auxenochlorella protothecoides TaxID=3075 RepID=A0A1D1ZRZ7_AUXPR